HALGAAARRARRQPPHRRPPCRARRGAGAGSRPVASCNDPHTPRGGAFRALGRPGGAGNDPHTPRGGAFRALGRPGGAKDGANAMMVDAFIYLVAAVVCVPLAKRLGLGSVLGYLIAGVAIGPWGLRLIDDVES